MPAIRRVQHVSGAQKHSDVKPSRSAEEHDITFAGFGDGYGTSSLRLAPCVARQDHTKRRAVDALDQARAIDGLAGIGTHHVRDAEIGQALFTGVSDIPDRRNRSIDRGGAKPIADWAGPRALFVD